MLQQLGKMFSRPVSGAGLSLYPRMVRMGAFFLSQTEDRTMMQHTNQGFKGGLCG